MNICVLYKTGLMELTAHVLIKALFLDKDVEVHLINIDKCWTNRGLVNEVSDDIYNCFDGSEDNVVVMLNNYSLKELDDMLSKMPSIIDKYVMQDKDLRHQSHKCKDIHVVNYSANDYFYSMVEALCSNQKIASKMDERGKDNIVYFASKIGVASSATLLCDLLIDLNYRGISYPKIISKEDLFNMSLQIVSSIDAIGLKKCRTDEDYLNIRKAHARILKLEEVIKLSKGIDDHLGAKLSLNANYKRLETYYRWLSNKFLVKQVQRQSKEVFANNFFTDKEISAVYRSLDSRLYTLSKELEVAQGKSYEREKSNGSRDTILVINTPRANKTLSELMLRMYYSQFDGEVIVCLVGDSYSIISKFNNDALKYIKESDEHLENKVQFRKHDIVSKVYKETDLHKLVEKI